jgi:hypothetical protein
MLTPHEFWLKAAEWGSAMTGGDPGSCMYGFDHKGLVQSEQHRQDCIDWLEKESPACIAANHPPGPGRIAEEAEVAELIAYLKNAPVEGALPEMDAFTEAYVTAALFSTNDESDESGGGPLDSNYSPEHIDPETLQVMILECAHFQATYGHLITGENYKGRSNDCQAIAGHDFWLTRNRHGAGFWDGDWSSDVEDILTKAAHSFGETDIYVEDGRICGDKTASSPASVLTAGQALDKPGKAL